MILVWEGDDLGSEGDNLGSEGGNLGSEGDNLGSEGINLRSELQRTGLQAELSCLAAPVRVLNIA